MYLLVVQLCTDKVHVMYNTTPQTFDSLWLHEEWLLLFIFYNTTKNIPSHMLCMKCNVHLRHFTCLPVLFWHRVQIISKSHPRERSSSTNMSQEKDSSNQSLWLAVPSHKDYFILHHVVHCIMYHSILDDSIPTSFGFIIHYS